MADYKFTERAELDLEEITGYTLKHWGALQVDTYLDGLEYHGQLLASNPNLGTRRDGLVDGLLSFPYESLFSTTSSNLTASRL